MILFSACTLIRYTLMAEIFAGLYVREFREYGKLAKIKSRKRSLEYCLEPVSWDVIVTPRLTKSESTQKNLREMRPTRVPSLQQGTCLSCYVVPGGRQAPGRCCRFKYSDKRGIDPRMQLRNSNLRDIAGFLSQRTTKNRIRTLTHGALS